MSDRMEYDRKMTVWIRGEINIAEINKRSKKQAEPRQVT